MAGTISLPKLVLDQLYASTAIKYVNFVATSILVYDVVLTIPDEIKYIWSWKWGAGKMLYFLTRYMAFIDCIIFHIFWFKPGLSAKECEILFNIGCWTLHVGIVVAQWILIMRTYAIWHQARPILLILGVLVFGADIPTFIILQDLLKNLIWAKSPFPTIAQCAITVPDNNLFVNFAIILVSEFVIVVLTVWRVIRQRSNAGRSGLLSVMYRDGILFFGCLFVISLCNSAIQTSKKLPELYIFLLPELQRTLHSVLTSRMIRHLREYTFSAPGHESIEIVSTLHYRLGGPSKDALHVQMAGNRCDSGLDFGYPYHSSRTRTIDTEDFEMSKIDTV